MKKKQAFLILSVLVFIFSFSVKPKQSYAALPVVSRVVAGTVGERVIIGMLEKGGMKLTTKTARQKAVERWNMELFQKIEYYNKVGDQLKADELKRFQDMITTKTDSDIVAIPTKQGFGNVAMNTAMFLTGIDVLYDVYKTIETAYNTQTQMERMKEIEYAIVSGEAVTSYKGIKSFISPEGGTPYIKYGWESGTVAGQDYKNHTWNFDPTKAVAFIMYNIVETSTSIDFSFRFNWTYQNGNPAQEFGATSFPKNTTTSPFISSNDYKVVKSIPLATDVPDVTTIQPWVEPLVTTGTTPTYQPETVSITVPTTSDYPEEVTTPWNEPETFTEPVAEPEPTPEPEIPPVDDEGTDWSWWNWLKEMLQSMLDWMNSLVDSIINGISSIFVPDAIAINAMVETLKGKIEMKLPLIPQLQAFFTEIKNATFGEQIPTFEITFPDKWGGGTYSIIDFKYFTDYRSWIINFIRFSAWFIFLRRLYNRIPNLIY